MSRKPCTEGCEAAPGRECRKACVEAAKFPTSPSRARPSDRAIAQAVVAVSDLDTDDLFGRDNLAAARGWESCLSRIDTLSAELDSPEARAGDCDALMQVHEGLMAAWEADGRNKAEGSHGRDLYDWAQNCYYASRCRLTTKATP